MKMADHHVRLNLPWVSHSRIFGNFVSGRFLHATSSRHLLSPNQQCRAMKESQILLNTNNWSKNWCCTKYTTYTGHKRCDRRGRRSTAAQATVVGSSLILRLECGRCSTVQNSPRCLQQIIILIRQF